MVNILVTGGAGFIGSHVVDILIERGHNVKVLDDLSGGFIENVNQKAEFIKGSILDKALVEQTVQGIDIIYHLAAYAAEGLSHNVRKFNYTNNLIGSINLINAAIKNKIKRFVFTSSIAVYGTSHGNPPFKEEDLKLPEDPYGIAKYAVELDLESAYKKFGLEFTILRPYNVYGERQFIGDPYRNVFGIFMNRIMQSKKPKIFGDGNQKRAFTYIGDVAPAIVNAGFSEEAKNEIINIGGGKVYTVNEIAEEILLSMSSNLTKEYMPPRYEVKHAWCDNSKATKMLGYEDKTSLKEGVSKMALWAKSKGHMNPIIWEGYELDSNLPEFWQNLNKEYPESGFRIRIGD
ncbi:NAD-dependent epimerase/dehydratase family protein [Candidatus Pacearchaeota archaeon]|nr:NAD-dependent epimerase/dehydratase family protein [Candidatus Pacearchaeota archaeon]